ncbi:MAG TPA: AbrB/MazE/SpoVT family DNA-binding domain-containing protein [Firmicutes bacterium]|nr:AbrB/MazE/SpoVT family DNA-binding domain-containing protein [Bacillota bacterium]
MSQVTTTVTSKGQVTIPASIGDEMRLTEGDRILFIRDADRFYIEKVPGKSESEHVFGRLSRPGVPTLDVEKARVQVRQSRASRHLVDWGKSKGE